MAIEKPALPVGEADQVINDLARKIADLPDSYRIPIEADISRLIDIMQDQSQRSGAQKGIEQELRESENRFQVLANSTPLPIFVTDVLGGNIFVNRAYREFLGVNISEVKDDLWQSYLHPDDGPAYVDAFMQAVHDQKPFKGEVRALRSDGDWRWLVIYAEPHFAVNGAYLGHVGNSMDITERKRAEQAVRESEQKFQSIFQNAPFPIVLLHAEDNSVADSNNAFLKLFGFQKEEVIGRTAVELGVVPDRAARAAIFQEIMEKGFVRNRELAYRTREGEPLIVLMNTDQVTIGGEVFLLTAVENITERKSAEAALLMSQAALHQSAMNERARANELEALMDAVPAMIWVSHDAECREMIGNRAGYELLLEGPESNVSSTAPQEVLTRQKYHNMKDGRLIPPSELPMQVAAATGKPARNYTHDIVLDDGTTYNVIGNVNPLFDSEGRPAGAVGAFVDITALRHLQAEQLESRMEIEVQRRLMDQREQERQQIARDIHDGPIQTLVSTIFNLQTTKEALPDRQLQVELSQIGLSLKSAVQELRQVVNELRPPSILLLGFSRAIQIHAEDFREKHPELHLQLDLAADRHKFSDQTSLTLFRIYQEGLNNIIRHAEATNALVRLYLKGERGILEIQDNGRGFDLSPNLAGQTQKGHYGIAGMKERAEALDGKLEIHSAPGKGTTIRLVFPLDQQEQGNRAIN